jgi:hypothetical protein
MNDIKGFDWNDPGLQALSPEEREARAANRDAGQTPPAPSSSPAPFEPPVPAPRHVLPGSPLPLGVGILGNKTSEAEWERLARPAQRSAPAPSSTTSGLAAAPPSPSTQARPSQSIAQKAAPASGVSLSTTPRTPQASTFQRAVNVFRAAMPIVQRVLPLLDGNVGSAVSNLMAPRPQTTTPQPAVNLAPLESGLSRLQLQQRELRDQITEQNVSLKKVEDQLQEVREATDRNTLEQQELLQDLKSVGTRVNVFAYIALALLGLSVLLNAFLFFELRRFVH